MSSMEVRQDVFIRTEKSMCLVNNDEPIYPYQLIYFEYGATFQSEIEPASGRPC